MTQPKDDQSLLSSTTSKLSKLIHIDSIMKEFMTTTSQTKLASLTSSLSPSSSSISSSPSTSSSSSTSSVLENYHLSRLIPKIEFELPNYNVPWLTNTTATNNRMSTSLNMSIIDEFTNQFHTLFSEKMDIIFMQNIKVLLVGASVGAAISAGVFIGIFSIGLLFSPSNSVASSSTTSTTSNRKPFSSIWRSIFWYKDLSLRNRNTSTNNNNTISTNEEKDEYQSEQLQAQEQSKSQSQPLSTKSGISTKENSDNDDNDNINDCNNVTTLKSSHQKNIIMIQGNPTTSTTIPLTTSETSGTVRIENNNNNNNNDIATQYHSCLDSITSSLEKESLSWNNVNNISVKLVSSVPSTTTNSKKGSIGIFDVDDDHNDDDIDDNNAKMFRNILKNYTTGRQIIENGNILVSIVFVLRLEDKNSYIQAEVLASGE